MQASASETLEVRHLASTGMTGAMEKTTMALVVAALAAFGYGSAVGKPLARPTESAVSGSPAR